MSKKKEIVRMWVARDKWSTARLCSYVLSFYKPHRSIHRDGEITWCATHKQQHPRHYIYSPKDFHKMFKFRLRPGQGPVLVEFPKIVMKAVKK